MNESRSEEMLAHVLAKICDSSREYRMMAKEFLKKADELEAMALQVALDSKRQDSENIREAMANAAKATPSTKDIFEDFGDMFSGKKGPSK